MHLTDDQLNEYLDEATTERVQIEAHLFSCDECAARFSTLQNVFTELDSLPELELTRDLAAPFTQALLDWSGGSLGPGGAVLVAGLTLLAASGLAMRLRRVRSA